MGRQTKSNSKVLDLVLSEDSFPPVVPQIMLTTKFLVYNCVARELLVGNTSIQCHAETGKGGEPTRPAWGPGPDSETMQKLNSPP